MNYEKFRDGHTHSITSGNIFSDVDTGRVVAVFYNDYDINDVVAQLDKVEALEAENFKLKEANAEVQSLELENEELRDRLDSVLWDADLEY